MPVFWKRYLEIFSAKLWEDHHTSPLLPHTWEKESCESAGFLLWAKFKTSGSSNSISSLLGFSGSNDRIKVGKWWAASSGRNLVIWGLKDNRKDLSHWMWAWEDAAYAVSSTELFEHKLNTEEPGPRDRERETQSWWHCLKSWVKLDLKSWIFWLYEPTNFFLYFWQVASWAPKSIPSMFFSNWVLIGHVPPR